MKIEPIYIPKFIFFTNLIHRAIVVCPIIVAIIFYLLSRDHDHKLSLYKEFPLILFLFAIPISIVFGNVLFKKHIYECYNVCILEEKLTNFRTGFIMRISLIEGPAIASTFIYYATLNLIYLIITAALVIYMILLAPTKEKIQEHLNLEGEEKATFNQMA